MRYRNRTSKPTALLWLLVVGADAALAVTGAGLAVLLWTFGGVTAVALAAAGVWLVGHRPGHHAPMGNRVAVAGHAPRSKRDVSVLLRR
ncbi:MAG TPA: hypothetical protein VFM55_20910 [Micromonosporaceae bacterium]|nr:hypothetical protein [Micromonosporaceae bacterium]